MGLRELFRALIEFFNREHIEFAVIGAFSLQAYGYVRATKDIDFLTRREHQDAIISYLDSLGFDTLQKSDAFSNHLHPVGTTRVDMMYVDGDTAQSILSAVKIVALLGAGKVPVVSPEHLIALKLFAAHNDPDRKYRELADIQEVVRRVDINEIMVREYFTKYGFGEMYEEIVRNAR